MPNSLARGGTYIPPFYAPTPAPVTSPAPVITPAPLQTP